jgi:multidrug efflux pump subunit AcrA (membrane-fusion protein)
MPQSANSAASPDLESIVDRLSALTRSQASPAEFYHELLRSVALLVSSTGAAAWLKSSRGSLVRRYEFSAEHNVWAAADEPWHAPLLARAVTHVEPWFAPNDEAVANGLPYVLLFAPLADEQSSLGVLEVLVPPTTDVNTLDSHARLVGLLADLAAEFECQRQRRELLARQALWNGLEQFIRRVHLHSDVDATACEIVNEGRLLIGCDRLSVATWDGQSCRLRAVSGIDAFDRRANTVRSAEALIDAILTNGAPAWWDSASDNPSPNVAQALEKHRDESHALRVAVLPLVVGGTDIAPSEGAASNSLCGALLIEQFDAAPWEDTVRVRAEAVAEHSALGLRNSVMRERQPLGKLSQWLAARAPIARSSRRRKLAIAAAVTAAVVAALCLIRTDFVVEARGTLEPAEQREVFASADAVVDRLLVEHGSRVTQGEPLIELRRAQVDFESSRVAGERQTARKRLASIQATRLATTPTDNTGIERYNTLTGEEEEIKEQLRSLDEQDRLLQLQRQELTLRSPIDGQVLTWDVEPLLAARPVQRGQVLLTVARTDGPWVLKLQVPDRLAGHLPPKSDSATGETPVSFILTAHPEQVHVGNVQQLAMATDVDEHQQPIVTVTVAVDRSQLSPLRPRATVLGKIHCGRKPIGYVWFHELWRAVQSMLLF